MNLNLFTLTVVLWHVFFFCSAQDVISTFGIKMISVVEETKQAQVIDNPQTGGFNLILSDLNKVYLYEMDSVGKIMREFSKKKTDTNYTELLGGIINDGITTAFLTDTRKDIISLSFGTNGDTQKKIKFLSGKERLIESFEYHQHFYFLTLQKNTSVLTLYKVNDTGKPEPHVIDLSRIRFANSSKNKLYNVLSDSVNHTGRLLISRIKSDIPNSLDAVLDGGKLYIENGKMIFTLDHSTLYTIFITVNLDNFNYKVSSLPQPVTACDNEFSRSNSFLSNGNLYQIKFCKEEIHFQIYDTCTKAIFKRHLVTPENFNIFRNTAISRIGTNDVPVNRPEKNLDSAKVTLKKITKGLPAILVLEADGQHVVTIGGESSFSMTLPISKYPASLIVNLTLHSEWTNYFRTLLDSNFDHQDGKITRTVFDEVMDYSRSNGKDTAAELLFRFKDQYILGYYNKELQQYNLIRFSDARHNLN